MGRAIVRDPKVFLFDEPLSNLDAKLRVAMRAEIKALHQRLKTTTVYVTHDQIEAMTMADRIVVMHDGIVEQIGTPLDLFDRPGNLFVAQFIGSPSMNVMQGTLRAGTEWQLGRGARPALARPPQARHLTASRCTTASGRATSRWPAGQGIPAQVVVVEPTGAETELLLQVGDLSKLVVVVHGRVDAQPDQTVGLAIDADRVHLFDRQSGRRMP
jgi:multiple sugar transport system ATP-binding protein